MKGWGRRAAFELTGELLLNLLLIGLFLLVMFPYIAEHTNGEAYFSKFYTADLATSADLVNAGYGDVVLRYDNLKQNLDLTFWLDNGMVVISKEAQAARDNVAIAYTPPPTALGQFYGLAEHYPTGLVVIRQPVFLVLRKANDNFAITEAETLLKACPGVEPVVSREDAAISLEAVGPGAEQIREHFELLVTGMNLQIADKDDANIRIRLERKNGAANAIEVYPTSPDGISYGCLFGKRLHAITLVEFSINEPSQRGTDFVADMTLTTADKVTEEQIAQALANALAVYYR